MSQKNSLKEAVNYLDSTTFSVLKNLQSKNGQYTSLTKTFLANPKFLKLVYHSMTIKPCHFIPSKALKTFDGISLTWFQKVAKEILEGKYSIQDCRYMCIPTKNKKLSGFYNLRDEIIQKAIGLLLETIFFEQTPSYTNLFSDRLHSKLYHYHIALKQIKTQWSVIPWYLKSKIRKPLDITNCNILTNKLQEKIKDQIFIDLFHKVFKTKNMIIGSSKNKLRTNQKKLKGFQDNVLYTLLYSTSFATFDSFMSQLIKKYHNGDRTTIDSTYLHKMMITKDCFKKCSVSSFKPCVTNQIISEKNQKAYRKKKFYDTLFESNYKRVKYVRYAENFIVGIRASKKTALKIKKEIFLFLQLTLYLTVNANKTKIIQIFYGTIKFGGITIHNIPTNRLSFRKTKHLEKIKKKKSYLMNNLSSTQKRHFSLLKKSFFKRLKMKYKKAENSGRLDQWEQNLKKTMIQILFLDQIDSYRHRAFSQFLKRLGSFWYFDKLATFLKQNKGLPKLGFGLIDKNFVLIFLICKKILILVFIFQITGFFRSFKVEGSVHLFNLQLKQTLKRMNKKDQNYGLKKKKIRKVLMG